MLYLSTYVAQIQAWTHILPLTNNRHEQSTGVVGLPCPHPSPPILLPPSACHHLTLSPTAAFIKWTLFARVCLTAAMDTVHCTHHQLPFLVLCFHFFFYSYYLSRYERRVGMKMNQRSWPRTRRPNHTPVFSTCDPSPRLRQIWSRDTRRIHLA